MSKEAPTPDPDWPHGYGFCHCGCGCKTRIATENRPSGQRKGEPVRCLSGHHSRLRFPLDPSRFWGKVKVGSPGECWPWGGSVDTDGYGVVRWGGRQTKAHRLAWSLENGPIPVGLGVLHRCDNPPCCNPACLFLGTNRDNVADRERKGRTARRKTDAEIAEMLACYATGEWTHRALAQRFEVSVGWVANVVTGRRRARSGEA